MLRQVQPEARAIKIGARIARNVGITFSKVIAVRSTSGTLTVGILRFIGKKVQLEALES